MYATLNADGAFRVVKEHPTLARLQETVGGRAEVVRLEDAGLDVWLNEDGKGLELDPNLIATEIARGMRAIFANDYIAGNVAFTGGADAQGNTLPLDESKLAGLRLLVKTGATLALGRMIATGRLILTGDPDGR